MSDGFAIVTGAGGGIGGTIALRLSRGGFAVALFDRDEKALEKTAADIHAAGGEALSFPVDLTEAKSFVAMLHQVPNPVVLVNNAGIFEEIEFAALSAEDFRRHFEIHAIAAFQAMQAVAPRMISGSRIINIASRSYLGGARQSHYAAAKGALVSLTRAAAVEFLPRGILVNAVAPGMVDTPLLQAFTAEELAARISRLPLRRPIERDDIAHAVSFLADSRTRFITGQVLIVDGGQSLMSPAL